MTHLLRMVATTFISVVAVSFWPAVWAQESNQLPTHYGQRTYEDRCAVCHGTDGLGDGPMASLLTPRPADLTTIAKRNDGVYPFSRVYKIIDGRFEVDVKAHGTNAMPVWGNAFRTEVLEAQLPGIQADDIVQGRILGLVYLLQTLQTK